MRGQGWSLLLLFCLGLGGFVNYVQDSLFSVDPLCTIAIVAKNLKPIWVIITTEPGIDVVSLVLSISLLSSVFCSVVVDVVDGKKYFVVFAAEDTFVSVMLEC